MADNEIYENNYENYYEDNEELKERIRKLEELVLKLKEQNEILKARLSTYEEKKQNLTDLELPTDEEREEFAKFLSHIKEAKTQVKISVMWRPIGSLEQPRFKGSIVADFTEDDLDTILEKIGANFGPGEYYLTFKPNWKLVEGVDKVERAFKLHKVIDIKKKEEEPQEDKKIIELKNEINEIKKMLDEKLKTGMEAHYTTKMFDTLTSFMAKIFPHAQTQMLATLPQQQDFATQAKVLLEVIKEAMNIGLTAQGIPVGTGTGEEDTLSRIMKFAAPFLDLIFKKPSEQIQTQQQQLPPALAYTKYVFSELAKYLGHYSPEVCANWLRQNLGINQIKILLSMPTEEIIKIEPSLQSYVSQIEEIKNILKTKMLTKKTKEEEKEEGKEDKTENVDVDKGKIIKVRKKEEDEL